MKNLAQLIREGNSLANATRILRAHNVLEGRKATPEAQNEPEGSERAPAAAEGQVKPAKPSRSRKKKPESEPSGS